MATSRLVFFLFVVSACQTGSSQRLAAGQTAASESNPSSRVIWISVHKNDSSPDLSASDLEVKLDGKPAPVGDIHRASPALRYCLLLDVSGSTRSIQSAYHDGAVGLLSKIPRPDRDYGLLVSFSNQAYLDAEGTDPQKLIKGIVQDGRGSTAVYDAMVAGSDYLSKNDSPDTPLRVMFVLSDGVDNSSRTTREDAERTLIEAGIRVYSIAEENAHNYRPDEAAKASKSLKQLVESTGGKEYLVNKRMTIDQIVQNISNDLSSLYAVTISPERTVSIGHVYKLEVRCRKMDCAVDSPREYFVSH